MQLSLGILLSGGFALLHCAYLTFIFKIILRSIHIAEKKVINSAHQRLTDCSISSNKERSFL